MFKQLLPVLTMEAYLLTQFVFVGCLQTALIYAIRPDEPDLRLLSAASTGRCRPDGLIRRAAEHLVREKSFIGFCRLASSTPPTTALLFGTVKLYISLADKPAWQRICRRNLRGTSYTYGDTRVGL